MDPIAGDSDDDQPTQHQLREKESVLKCVDYVLHHMGSKYGMKKSEFQKLLEPGCRFDRTLPQVQKKLSDAYGLELAQLPDCGTNKEYLAINKLPKTMKLHHQSSDDNDRRYATALLLSLAQIFLNNGASTRESLVNFLNRFPVFPEDDGQFVKDLIDVKFRRQHYLTVYKAADASVAPSQRSQRPDEPEDVKLKWGFRAEMEYTRMEILTFIAKVYQRPAISFPRLYRLATGQSEEGDGHEDNATMSESDNEGE